MIGVDGSSMSVKITDVAAVAGVSTATVSRVLNGKSVRPGSARAVEAAVKQLSYSPNKVGRKLRRRTGEVIGLIVADIENPFFTAFARGVEDVAQQRNLSVVLCNSDENPRKESTYLQIAIDEQLAGVVICPADPNLDVGRLLDSGIAVVAVDRPVHSNVDQVILANERIALEATRELIRRGAKRIACITGPATTMTSVERAHGWASALEEAKLPVPEEYLMYTDFRISGGLRAASQLLLHGTPPDAVLATNNMVGIGAIRSVATWPYEPMVAVIGELPYATSSTRDILISPLRANEMGRLAAQMLHERIVGSYEGRGRTVITGPFPRTDTLF